MEMGKDNKTSCRQEAAPALEEMLRLYEEWSNELIESVEFSPAEPALSLSNGDA